MPGVQDLIAKLVRDPGFKALVSSPEAIATTKDADANAKGR
jgi:hypothetical protein